MPAVYGRAEFSLYAVTSILGFLGMFFVAMGAAFTGKNVQLAFAGALFLAIAVRFVFACIARARHLGWQRPVAFGIGSVVVVPLIPVFGLIPVGYLLVVPGTTEPPRIGAWSVLKAVFWAVWPWVVMFLVVQVTRP